MEKLILVVKENFNFMATYILTKKFCIIIPFCFVKSRFLMKKCPYDLVVDIKISFSFDI